MIPEGVLVAVVFGALAYAWTWLEDPREQPIDPGSVSVSPSHQAARERDRNAKMPCRYCGRERGGGVVCAGCGAPAGPKQYGPNYPHRPRGGGRQNE